MLSRSRPFRAFAPALALCTAFAALPAPAEAQCTTSSVQFQKYGAGCNALFGQLADLSGSWDPQSCSVSLTLTGFPGCCNTFLVGKVLVFGTAQIHLPLPFLGQGCALLVLPVASATLPRGGGDTTTFRLPPGIRGGTIYAQGVNHYFTTIGMTDDFALSQGLAIAIR